MTKKLISVFLSICMVLSLAQTAFAATSEIRVLDTEEDLIAALADGGDVVLGGNIAVTTGLIVSAGVTVTLDLAGYTVSMVDASSTTSALIKNEGILIVNDSSEEQTGKLSFSTTTPDTKTTPSYASNTITNAGVLTVNGGTIENTSASGSACYAIDTAWHTTDISITINGGTIRSTTNKAIRVVPYSATAKCTLNINGGTISGSLAAVQVFNTSSDAKLVDVNISGGALSGTYAFYTSYTNAAAHAGTDIDISGASFNGAVYIYNGKAGSSATNFANVSITGGTFNGATYVYTKDANSEAVAIPAISGGIFSEDVSDYLVEGTKIDENGAVVVDAVAVIGDKGYASVQAAIADAGDGETVTLVDNVELAESVKVAKKITLDLNGYSISGADNSTGSFGLINIDPGADLTINDSSENKTGKITLTASNDRDWNAYSSVISNQRGKLTVNGGTVEHLGGTDMAYGIDNLTNGQGTYAETIINGGTVKSTYRAIRQFLNGTEAQNILTVNGGNIEGANKSIWMQDPSTNANTGALTVSKDATLNGDVYLFVTAGSTEWPVTVSIAAAALNGESAIRTGNVPDGYALISYTDDAGNVIYDVDKVAEVTFMVGDDVVDIITVKIGEDVTLLEVPEKEGYTGAWDHDGKNITADTTINAVYTIKQYTVTYKNGDDVVDEVTVEHGADATAPAVPEKEGYTGAWDHDGKNITADTTINAVYTIKKYTVTYMADNQVVATIEVEHGKDATPPAIPEKEGYTKTAPVWDKDGKNITVDTTINAVYTINEYTVTFMDGNRLYKTLSVKHGEAVEMPAVPTLDGYIVTWDKTVTAANSDMTINAVYTKDSTIDPSDSDDNDPDPDDSKADKNPQTGDNSNLWLWFTLLIVSAGGVVTLTFYNFKRKSSSEKNMK